MTKWPKASTQCRTVHNIMQIHRGHVVEGGRRRSKVQSVSQNIPLIDFKLMDLHSVLDFKLEDYVLRYNDSVTDFIWSRVSFQRSNNRTSTFWPTSPAQLTASVKLGEICAESVSKAVHKS